MVTLPTAPCRLCGDTASNTTAGASVFSQKVTMTVMIDLETEFKDQFIDRF
jgi:hypothetical protein